MSDLWHVVRSVVADMLAERGTARHGTVKSVNPANGTVKVDFGDADFPALSGWLPVAQIAAGNGWSAVCLPAPGTQVFCAPDMGDSGSMVVVGAVHSTQQPAGKVTPYKGSSGVPLTAGELTLMGPDGQFIRFPAGGGIQSRGTWIHDGDLKTSGQVRDLDGVHGTLDDLRQAYNLHKHVDPQGGSVSTTDHPTS